MISARWDGSFIFHHTILGCVIVHNLDNKLKDIFDDLKNGVRDIFEGPNYKHYLEVMTKFHNYSANNWRLIYKQCPNATKVAGYKQWQEDFDRYVKKGEKAIRIIAPSKDYGFIEVCVFDFSQTDGTPLPTDGIEAYQLESNVKNYNILLKALKKTSPLPIYFEKLEGCNGSCYIGDKIKINTGMSEAQTLKTIIHEIAHAILHTNSTASKEIEEIEAESIAFAVCSYLGIDSSSFSFGYIAKYSRDLSEDILLKILDTITETTKSLIHKIRKELGLSIDKVDLKDDISQSLYEEGQRYYDYTNDSRDYNKAFQYFLDAASYGHKKAIYKVAFCYEYGIGTDKDSQKALEWYIKIPDNQDAQFAIGYHIFYQNKNQRDAFIWFVRSANQGHIKGECFVGLYYMYSYGNVEKDYIKASEWLAKSANRGYSDAQYHLAVLHSIEKNEEESLKWFLKAAEQNHDLANQALIKLLETGKLPDRTTKNSFEWLHKIAKQGHRIAQYEIGNHYYTGKTVEQNYTLACIWYLDSAKQNYPNAQFMLGICYQKGYGIKVSFEKSFEYFKLVADSPTSELCGSAKYELANYYSEGLGVERDLAKAFVLYQEAIACGFNNARLKIAPFYLNGITVEKDIAKGVEILLEAYQQGSKESKNIIIETFTNNDNYKHQKSISFVEKIKNYLGKLFS